VYEDRFFFLLALPITFASAQGGHQRRYELRPDPNWPLSIELSSGEYEIVASESDGIAVVYEESKAEDAVKVHVQIASGHGQNSLKIAGPKSNFHAVIEVPRKTDLRVRLLTGSLHVGDVEGNKDIEIRTGNLELSAIHPQDYAETDFSVRMGDVNAPVFKVVRSGLWRSIKMVGPGKYRLHAHVGVGDLTLHAEKI